MDEETADNDEFANVALCICSAAENLNASQDELAHVQVSTGTKAPDFVNVMLMYVVHRNCSVSVRCMLCTQ